MNYLLRGIGVLATVGTISMLAFSLPSGGEARGDGGGDALPRLTHKNWQQECASCHTANPKQAGQTRVGKRIEPLAPAANPERFTDAAQVEKWFRRNCMDVLQRECSAQEKGDFIAWLSQIK